MEKYDVIVVGAGIAGLGVAGLLQKQRLKTLLLEKSKTLGGRAKTFEIPGGWKVDSGTHCVNLGKNSAYAELLKRVGKNIKWSRPIEGLMIFDQGKWVDVRDYMELSGKNAKEFAELERKIGNSTDEEIDHLDTVSLAQFIGENVDSPKIAEFCEIIGNVQTTLTDPEHMSAGEFTYIYREALRNGGMLNSNVQMPVGGIGVITHAQADAFMSFGGTLKLGTTVKEVIMSANGVGGVRTESEEFRASRIVLAMPMCHLSRVLPMKDDNSPLPRAWRERMNSILDEASASLGYNVGTSKPLFTEPVYLSVRSLPGSGLPLQVFGHTNFDDTIAPPGHMIAFIGTCCTPSQARDEEFRKNTLAVFWETIKEMFPIIEESVVWKTDGFSVGIDGLGRSPRLTGKYRPKVYLDEIPGLYFAGDCYTGRGVGMNSAARSAMICADRIMADTL